MNSIEEKLIQPVKDAFNNLYGSSPDQIEFQETRKEFEGDITFVTFPFLRLSKKSPEQTGNELGTFLVENVDEITSFNVVKGFLNLVVSDDHWKEVYNQISSTPDWGIKPVVENEKASMVEFSSPNTNKPLHLGHIRNNLLGDSVSRIIEATGKKVYKVQIINDRGIHICKSMVAWLKFGEGKTPEDSNLKGDKLVGNYYVEFDKEYKKQIQELIDSGMDPEEAKKKAAIMVEAQEMLRKWEEGDQEILGLWNKMNGWVYSGFNETYENLGISFDKNYYESDTYILGKEQIEKGLKDGVFFKKDDGSVWIDLTKDKLDEKIVLRSDGTSVYMTQDIGTAILRFEEFDIDQLTYVVGNEQDYHFKVLFKILEKLGFDWSKELHHLSYGMVDLPSGKMKSREGTVVDADELMDQMFDTAREKSDELGKLEGYSEEEKKRLYRIIGLGALKYFILKVDPKKRILFNPEESIDFQGNTGPFIQYTYARIQSLIRRGEAMDLPSPKFSELAPEERDLIKMINKMPDTVKDAADNQSPAVIANYVYELVKLFNHFYQNQSILHLDDLSLVSYRLELSRKVAEVIQNCLRLLGIESPERM